MAQVGLGGIILQLTGTPYFESADIGPQALGSTIIGHGSGNIGIATGTTNVFLGENIAVGLTIGIENTCVGQCAGQDLTIGNENTLLGKQAGQSMASGTLNVAVGHGALYLSVAVGGCVAVGANSGHDNVGNWNTYIGWEAGYKNTSGSSNVAIGRGALYTNTTRHGNIAIGADARWSDANGYSGVYIGMESGWTGSGFGNVFLGYKSGWFETGNNKLFIDNTDRANEADARIKALIYGIFDAATANQWLRINGHFGILLSEIPAGANNAAAQAAGLAIGDFYRTNADPSVLCIRSA